MGVFPGLPGPNLDLLGHLDLPGPNLDLLDLPGPNLGLPGYAAP